MVVVDSVTVPDRLAGDSRTADTILDFFLAAFLLLLGVYWTIFQTQVPFYPSGAATWQGVAGLLPPDRPVRVVDVGSGLGGLVLYLAAVRPDNEVTGIELAPLPWLVSVLRRRIASSRAEFLRGDYGALDFGQYDVVFLHTCRRPRCPRCGTRHVRRCSPAACS
ncbi:class I SAM-dependent methyltransferase [Undibacterium arcticum]